MSRRLSISSYPTRVRGIIVNYIHQNNDTELQIINERGLHQCSRIPGTSLEHKMILYMKYLQWLFLSCTSPIALDSLRRRRGSVVRASDLNAFDPGSNPALTTGWICLRVTLESNPPRLVNNQLVCLLPVGVLNCIYIFVNRF